MKLPFGKKVMCGNYYVLKHIRTLSRSEARKLRRDGLPAGVKRYLENSGLPYITVGTVSQSWKVDFVAGFGPFAAIDEIPVAFDEDNNYTYYGDYYKALGNIISSWFCYTSTVGDEEYQKDIINAMTSYLDRNSEKEKEPLDELEDKKTIDEIYDTENNMRTLLDMADKIKEGEKDGE